MQQANPFKQKAGGEPPASLSSRLPGGTGQQEALWGELVSGTGSVLVEARAGSGKSSSCREGMWRMLDADPGLRMRYAVFSKANADEFRAGSPPGVDVGTIHSFGFEALRKACAAKLERNKTYLTLDETREGRAMPKYLRKSVALLVSQAKNQGLAPDEDGLEGAMESLLTHYDINAYGRPGWLSGVAAAALRRAAQWTELIDFDDMVWLPAIHGLPFPAADVLFLDEVQDWNPAQHALIPSLCRSGRVVAVGDRFQSIYAFRGADADSIPRLQSYLSSRAGGLVEMPLTVTWRCPKLHVEMAQVYVPDLLARPEAIEGEVGEATAGKALSLYRPGDMVLCPTNAPLVTAALRLIASRRRALVRGRAVGDQLLQVVRAAGEARTVADLAKGVEAWKARELTRLSDLDGVEDLVEGVMDRAAGVQAVLSTVDSPAQVEPAIAELFSDDADPRRTPSSVVFSTVHRAKGLEAESVWFLPAAPREPKRDWEAQQQRNLRYVALTRSKRSLTFVEGN